MFLLYLCMLYYEQQNSSSREFCSFHNFLHNHESFLHATVTVFSLKNFAIYGIFPLKQISKYS